MRSVARDIRTCSQPASGEFGEAPLNLDALLQPQPIRARVGRSTRSWLRRVSSGSPTDVKCEQLHRTGFVSLSYPARPDMTSDNAHLPVLIGATGMVIPDVYRDGALTTEDAAQVEVTTSE